jgi:hypothetical protein
MLTRWPSPIVRGVSSETTVAEARTIAERQPSFSALNSATWALIARSVGNRSVLDAP